MNKLMEHVESKRIKSKIEPVNFGDTAKVFFKDTEAKKERLQSFEGVVISVRGTGLGKSIKLRKMSYGVGVERTFILNSPRIEKIEILNRGRVKRAKLFYLRDKKGNRALKLKSERLGIKLIETGESPENSQPSKQ